MADVDTARASRPRVKNSERPLSPHLEVYSLTMTMVMSGLHRITGVVMYFGVVLLVWWLLALSTDAGSFQTAANVLGSWFGRLVIFGFSWTLFHHLMGGVRHALWDAGKMLDPKGREQIAVITLVGSLSITVVVWAVALIWG